MVGLFRDAIREAEQPGDVPATHPTSGPQEYEKTVRQHTVKG